MKNTFSTATWELTEGIDELVAQLNEALAALNTPIRIYLPETGSDDYVFILGKNMTEKRAQQAWEVVQPQ